MTAPVVLIATEAERRAIEGMMQLYAHDFSEFWAGEARGELDALGRFPDYPLDGYWRDADRVPLLLRTEDGHLAGFALLNTHAHSGRPLDWSMAEFFVVRKHRRDGFGTAAARTIFTRYPGQWETAVARRNRPALEFWRRAAGGHPDVSDLEETDVVSDDWNGPILRFRVAG